MERLEVRGGPGEPAAGREHAGHLGDQCLGTAHVLQHLLAVDEVVARVLERQVHAIERHELCVRPGALVDLRRPLDVHAHPADGGFERAEEFDGVARAAAEVHHTRLSRAVGTCEEARCVVVGDRLAAVVAGDAPAEQLSEIVAEHGARVLVAHRGRSRRATRERVGDGGSDCEANSRQVAPGAVG
jgi:hypothetical protein